MSDEDIVKELVKQIPVKQIYDDGVAPTAKQVGYISEDILKTVRLALAPVQFLAALQDRYRAFLDRAVRRVAEEDRIAPPPQILGPVLEGIKYEPEGTPIDEMFSSLLSKALNQNSISEAHPAYPSIIKQLSSDEAKLLVLMSKKTFKYSRIWRLGNGVSYPDRVESDDLPRTELIFPDNAGFYIDHLHQLGLAGLFQVPPQEPIVEDGRQLAVRVKSEYRLTEIGQRFVRACTSL